MAMCVGKRAWRGSVERSSVGRRAGLQLTGADAVQLLVPLLSRAERVSRAEQLQRTAHLGQVEGERRQRLGHRVRVAQQAAAKRRARAGAARLATMLLERQELAEVLDFLQRPLGGGVPTRSSYSPRTGPPPCAPRYLGSSWSPRSP